MALKPWQTSREVQNSVLVAHKKDLYPPKLKKKIQRTKSVPR